MSKLCLFAFDLPLASVRGRWGIILVALIASIGLFGCGGDEVVRINGDGAATGPDTTPPSTPSNLAATPVSAAQINLSWTPATDDVGVTGYNFFRGGIQIATLGAVTTFQNNGLTASTAYSYTVQAFDAAGNVSTPSSSASATTQAPAADTTAPSAPTGLSATAASSSQINLSWIAATDNVGVTGYNVFRGGIQIATLGAVTTFQNTGLTPSTNYSYTVRSFDAAGNVSTPSSSASATTAADTTTPSTPTGLTATAVSSSQINLSWTAATDNVGVTGYNVFRGGIQIATLGAVTTFQNTGLTASTNYSYTVRAFDAAGNVSTPSSSAIATTAADTTAPSTPTGLTATAVSSSQINLSWTAATDNVGVVQYRVERCQGSLCSNFAQIGTTPGTTTTFSDTTGLVPNTILRYRVRAADAAPNLSPYSNLVDVTTPPNSDVTPPVISSGAPTGTLAAGTTQATMSVASNESATCKWDTSAATSYAAMPNTFTTTGGTFHSTQLTGLVNGQSYTRYVRCQDGANNANTSSYTVSFSVGTGAGTITLSLNASRTSGVAPLAVFFDASGTTSPLTSKPFHDIEYRWDFGDRDVNTGDLNMSPPITGATTWATGSRAGDPLNLRNLATGPVAAHVYETTGTYTVTLTAVDGTNTDTTTVTITVDNPDDLFAAGNTFCIGATALPVAGAGGCPAGALGVQQSNFVTVIATRQATGKRLLFKRGDIFTASTTADMNVNGPWTIGAYGSGNKPTIQRTGAGGYAVFGYSPSTATFGDGRIMDLDIDGLNESVSFGTIVSGTSFKNLTVLRVDMHGVNFGYNYDDAGGSRVFDRFFIVDSTVNANPAGAGYGLFARGLKFAFMGNLFSGGGNHNIRTGFLNKAVMSNNTSQNTNGDALKIHAPTFTGSNYTEVVVISDNKFSTLSPLNLWIQPQNSASDERIRNVLVERNWLVGGATQDTAAILHGSELTFRNNIMDSTAAAGKNGVEVGGADTAPASDNVRVYNNTFFSNSSSASFQGVILQPGTTNVKVQNNLAYAPAATSPVMIRDNGSISPVKTFNSSDSQVKNTSPLFTVMPPGTTVSNYRLLTGSYAINSGTTVPVFSDFFRGLRPNGSWDLGATEF